MTQVPQEGRSIGAHMRHTVLVRRGEQRPRADPTPAHSRTHAVSKNTAWPESRRRRHAAARARRGEACPGQGQVRGGTPGPGRRRRRQAPTGARPRDACRGQSEATGKTPGNIYWSRSHLPEVMLLPLGTRSGNLPKVGVRHDQPAVPDSPTKGRTAPATFGRYTVCVPTKGRNFKSSILHAKMESEITGVCTYRTSGTHCCAPTKGSRGNPTFGRYTKKCTYQR